MVTMIFAAVRVALGSRAVVQYTESHNESIYLRFYSSSHRKLKFGASLQHVLLKLRYATTIAARALSLRSPSSASAAVSATTAGRARRSHLSTHLRFYSSSRRKLKFGASLQHVLLKLHYAAAIAARALSLHSPSSASAA